MVVVSYSGKEINAKLVYYGAGLSGKTTNLESIYEAVPDTSRGKMVSMKTQSDRTLFFDLLPLDLGEIMGFKTRFLLYTVPGQVFYNATRKLVLKGADAIVFVADSELGKMEENRESIANLRANLAEYGLSLDEIPWVIQYNKRDLPNLYTVEELNAELNMGGKIPFFEAVATQGKGVFETFRGISHLLMEKVTRELRRTPMGGAVRPPDEAVVATPAAKPEPPRMEPARLSPGTLSTPPGRAIAREVQETPAPETASVGGLDYGREIELPSPASAGAVTPLPVSEPVAAVPPSRSPMSAAASRSGGESPEPASLRSAPDFEPLEMKRETPAQAASAAPRPTASPAPRPAASPASRPAAKTSKESARPDPTPGSVVVPVRLPKGGTREIVLRIVLSDDETSAAA